MATWINSGWPFIYFSFFVDIPDKISKILITEHTSSCSPPKAKPIETHCPAVTS